MASGGGNWKALYAAARTGDLEQVKSWLSEPDTDPNGQHVEFGTTPLIAAAENGHLEVVKALVAGGADPKVVSDWDGVNAAQAAAANGYAAVAEWLDGR